VTRGHSHGSSIVGSFAGAAIALATALTASTASGADITFGVIAPHQYDLPINYKPFNLVTQFGYWNHNNERFDSSGRRQAGPGTDTFFGVSSYARFFTFRFLPSVGWAVGVFLTEVRIQGPGLGASGFGDPLAGVAAWIKPSPNTTVGLQSYLAAPFGASDVSNHYWANISTLFFDLNAHRFNLTGDAGGVFRSTRHATDLPDLDKGNSFFTNIRLSYRVHRLFEPFLAFDFQISGSDSDARTGLTIPDSDSRESAWGAGVLMRFSDRIDLAARYAGSIEGKNTNATNAIYARFVLVF
jgi:hypothetical protein